MSKTRPFWRIGNFLVSLFDGAAGSGLLIEDVQTGEAGQFKGPSLEQAIRNLWDEHF